MERKVSDRRTLNLGNKCQTSELDENEEIFLTALNCTNDLKKLQSLDKYTFLIQDKSSNGTYLNDTLVGKDNSVEIKDGDTVSFADWGSPEHPNVKYVIYKFSVM